MIYDKIKKLCEEKGLSIRELEIKAGIGNAVVREWNDRSPRLDILQKVAAVLEISIDELVKE